MSREAKQLGINYDLAKDAPLVSTGVVIRRLKAAGMRVNERTVRRYCEVGLFRSFQPYEGAYRLISLPSVDEFIERTKRQLAQLDPPPEKGE